MWLTDPTLVGELFPCFRPVMCKDPYNIELSPNTRDNHIYLGGKLTIFKAYMLFPPASWNTGALTCLFYVVF